MDVHSSESDSLIDSNPPPQNYSGDNTDNTTTRATSTSTWRTPRSAADDEVRGALLTGR